MGIPGFIGEISVAGYYNCCGSKIIHSLVYHSDLVAWILIRAAILATWGNGSLQYICTNKQKRIENALIGNGFKLVQKVRNPKTGRCLLLYVYNQKWAGNYQQGDDKIKCLACDCILSDREATRRFIDSKEFVDLCDGCIKELPEDLRFSENLQLDDDLMEK